MNYDDLAADFAARTQVNLETLRRVQRERPDLAVYEVTQLINSMLGLLVLPKERFWQAIPEAPLEALTRQGWPDMRVKGQRTRNFSNLKELVRYMRNAIAHFNIEFLADGTNQITGIKLGDKRPGTEMINWDVELTLGDLEAVAVKLVDLLCPKSQSGAGPPPRT